MSTITQIAWHARYYQLNKEMNAIVDAAQKEAASAKASATRKVAHMKARKDAAEARIANKFLKERAVLTKRLETRDRVLRRAILVIEECCVPSPHAKDSREQILDVLRLYKELK